MSPRFNSGKSMSQIDNDYMSDSISSSEGASAHGDHLTNESGDKSLTEIVGRKIKQKIKSKKAVQLCVVCNDVAAGTYFGASVCLPCKSFYIRCTKDDPNPKFSCAFGDKCQINKQNRLRCQSCRFKKCLEAGMHRKEKLDYVEPSDGQELCLVCGDIANGCHFGIFTCEGCKKFYRRGMHEAETYECKTDKQCPITPRTRNDCRYCRYQKCLAVGMSRQAIKMGRPKKTPRRDEITKSEPVHQQVTSTVTQDVGIQMMKQVNGELILAESKPEITSLVMTDSQLGESQTSDLLTSFREATPTHQLGGDSSTDCGSLVSVEQTSQSLMGLSGADIPTVTLADLTDVKTNLTPTVSVFSSTVDTTQQSSVKAKDDDLISSVDVDLDNFIKTLDEQEEAILSAQVEQITSTSGSEYGQIIHWLKEKESTTTSQNFFQQFWEPMRSPPDSELALSSGSSVHFANEMLPADGRLQPLKPLSGAGFFPPSDGDYLTLTSQKPEPVMLPEDSPIGTQAGSVVTAGMIDGESVVMFGEQSDNAQATAAGKPARPAAVGGVPPETWFRHRSSDDIGTVLSSTQDESEIVSSSGQVKRRPLDSDLSEVAPKIFRMDYWISQISVEIPQFNETHHKLLSKLQTAYESLVEHADESKIPMKKNTLDAAEETRNSLKSVTKRIIRSLSTVMNFALSIPGFKGVEQSDQFHLVKYGGFHMMIILAGREQYVPEKHTFKYFWNAAVPSNHPAYQLRQDLLDAGKAVYWLKLDQVEAASLGALALISTDWLQLNFPNRLETINKLVIDSFLAYVINKHGRVIGNSRIREMFELMPTLRELTLRHAYYMQNLQLVVDASELVKMCECISLDDRR